MNSGDFVYIEYVGKVKDSGEIFDTTKEELAKKEGIYNPKTKYVPIPIIVDSDFIMPGWNEALKEMKVDETKIVLIPPEKAFGERKMEYVQLIPLAAFKDQEKEVKPGAYINVRGIAGKIVSVDGGRVRVDFNHPLAGKLLEYEFQIIKKIDDINEKVKSIVFYFTQLEEKDYETVIKEKVVEINIKKKVNILREAKEKIASTITNWIKELKVVKFVEIFEK